VVDGSVIENLFLPFSFRINQHRAKPGRERIENLLKTVHLGEVALTDHAGTLSLGQMQRLCLIRGLLLEPDVLLLDEPTSALDGDSASAVTALLERLNLESHLTVLSATHHAHGGQHVPYRYLRFMTAVWRRLHDWKRH
jgi:putative ABC transport system ATP-binding protein